MKNLTKVIMQFWFYSNIIISLKCTRNLIFQSLDRGKHTSVYSEGGEHIFKRRDQTSAWKHTSVIKYSKFKAHLLAFFPELSTVSHCLIQTALFRTCWGVTAVRTSSHLAFTRNHSTPTATCYPMRYSVLFAEEGYWIQSKALEKASQWTFSLVITDCGLLVAG